MDRQNMDGIEGFRAPNRTLSPVTGRPLPFGPVDYLDEIDRVKRSRRSKVAIVVVLVLLAIVVAIVLSLLGFRLPF